MKRISKIILGLSLFLAFTSCEKETTVTPLAKFKINSVRVDSMPAVDFNNIGWDLFDDADVFFNIEDENHVPNYLGSSFKVGNVAQADLPVSWALTSQYEIKDISKITYVALFDYDVLDDNDAMGYVGFEMQDYEAGKPTTITKSSGALTVTITGVWY
jgi:hypothetical protein